MDATEFLRDIIALLPGHIYWKDTNGVYLGCNFLQAKSAGLNSPQDIVGKTDFDLLPFEQAAMIDEDDKAVFKQKKEKSFIEKITLNDGSVVYFFSRKMPLLDKQKNVIGLLGISVDITERKKLEEKLAIASQEKSAFIAALNNTLRSPIQAITSMVDLLRETELTEEQGKYLSILEEANNMMPGELEYARDYTKLDSGDYELYRAPMRLVYSVDSLHEHFYKTAHARGIEFYVNYTNLPEVWLNNSVVQIRKALSILLDNMVHYTKEGYVQLHFERKNKTITIIMEDSSPGFESKYLEKIFSEAGFGSELEADYPLMSMRFAFCRKMVNALGGKIWAQSNKGKGAKFCLSFPEGKANKNDPMPDQQAYQLVNGLPIILVSENNRQTETILSFFEKNSISHLVPQKLVAHLKKLREQRADIDIILIDEEICEHRMQLLDEIRQVIDNTGTLIIVLTRSTPSYLLSQRIDEHRNIVTLKKPILWTRFFHELLGAWHEFLEPQLHILVVEDNPICQRSQEAILESLDCKVTLVSSGEQALKLVDQIAQDELAEMFDVIIMDIGLPGIEGTKTAQKLKERYQDKCPPIIAHTGYTRQTDLDKLQELNIFDDFLEKPASREMVQDTLIQLRSGLVEKE